MKHTIEKVFQCSGYLLCDGYGSAFATNILDKLKTFENKRFVNIKNKRECDFNLSQK